MSTVALPVSGTPRVSTTPVAVTDRWMYGPMGALSATITMRLPKFAEAV
jgi:hypothetical protein